MQRIILGSGLLALILFTQASSAQENNDYSDIYTLPLAELLQLKIDVTGSAVQDIGLQETSVTGNPLQIKGLNSGISLDIIKRDTMEARGLRNVVDAVRSMTGVIVGESPAEPYSFSMRGFDRSAVNVLYDGISMGVSNLNMRPIGTSHLERVEAIKGPTSLVGGGSAGGTINIVPREPEISPWHIGSGTLTYGSFESLTLAANLGGPITDSSAYLVNVDQRVSGGWVDNSASRSTTLSASVLKNFSPELSLMFAADVFEDSLPGYWGTPFIPEDAAIRPTRIAQAGSNRIIDESTRENNYNVRDDVIESDSHWLRAKLDWQVAENIHSTSKFYVFNADRRWENAENYIYQADTDNILRDRLLVTHDRELLGLQSEIVFDNRIGGLDNKLAVILEYSDNAFYREVGFNTENSFVDTVDLHNPQPGVFAAADIDIRDDYYEETRWALVLEDRLEITRDLFLDLGWRSEFIDFEQARFNFDGSMRQQNIGDEQLNSYRLGMVYCFTKELRGYVQRNRQHDSFQRAISDFYFESAQPFDAPNIVQDEAGIKTRIGESKHELRIAAYQITKQNLVNNNGELQSNKQHADGLEFSARFNLQDNIRLGATWAYIDARFGPWYDANQEVEANHNTPINIPEDNISLWFSYSELFSQPLEFVLNVNHVSDRYADIENTTTYQRYELVNAVLSYTRNQYRIALHGRNLGDELYVPFSEPFYPDQAILGPPRSIELSVQFVF